MPPKRQTRAVTPPKKKARKNGQNGPAQSSIDAFFTSPSKVTTTKVRGRETSVISFVDSDDAREGTPTPTAVPKRARNTNSDPPIPTTGSKGKNRAAAPVVHELPDDEDDDVKPSSPPYSSPPGINGSSSSSHPLPPIKSDPAPDPPLKAIKKEVDRPIHPMFARPAPSNGEHVKTPPPPDEKIKPDTPSTPQTITSTAAEAVEPLDFDTDAFLFRPEKIDVSKWPKGRLPYSVLVGVYVQVSSTKSRLFIVRVLTNFLHLLLHHAPSDLPPSLYLLSNHLLPNYLPCELGIGSQILTKAVQDVSGCQPRDLKKLWEKRGDPGDVAYEAKNNLRTLVTPSPLLVYDVYKRLLSLSKIKGTQSGKVKGDVVRKLMVQARGEEVRFLVRSMIGNLRIGAVRLTLLTALARATALLHMPKELIEAVRPIPAPPPKAEKGQKRQPRPKIEPDPAREEVEARCLEAVKLVRKVYVRHPNYGDLVVGLDAGGLEGLEDRVPVNVGIPLSPMLGSITRSLQEVFTRLGTLPFTAEAKLDGQRVQVHARLDGQQGEDDGGGRWVQNDAGDKVWVRLFSRHLEDMTEKYPDICQMILTILFRAVDNRKGFPQDASTPSNTVLDLLKAEKITSLIMDAEVVAVDKNTGAYRTFQELTNRAKKDVRVEDIKVVVGVYAFDLMLLNDRPLLEYPFSHRRHLLRTLFPPFADPDDPTLARFAHVESLDSSSCTDTPAEMQAFFEQVVEQKCEGIMIKLLETGETVVDLADEDESDVGDTPRKKRRVKEEDEDGEGSSKKNKTGKKKPLPATYEPDQRSMGWMKVKKDYLEGLGDSLDLVPIGAWWGQGRKAGWWSPILLACHNEESGALEAVCKCISGFTDQFYKDLLVRYPPHNALPEKCSTDNPLGYYETNGLRPDVWFEPSEVWEIRGADITLSPVYPAAATLLGSERGLSIRFPRHMRIREDKSWEQATTAEQFADMYRKQIREAPARAAVETASTAPPVIRLGSEDRADDEAEEGEEAEDYADGDGSTKDDE